jgi:hypothetical protein
MAEGLLATTADANVNSIPGVWLRIPNTKPPRDGGVWRFKTLPEVQVQKDATYGDVTILGRSSPVKTYSGSGYRKLSVTFHLHSFSEADKNYNLLFIRALDSLLHPIYEDTYMPPPVAQFRCGNLVGQMSNASTSLGSYVHVICMNTSYTLDPSVVWIGRIDLFPVYISVQASFDIVYPFSELPGQKDVINGNY